MSTGGEGRLLLLGASARALARSALAGARTAERFPAGVLVLDYFGDQDLEGNPRARILGVARDFGQPRSMTGLGRAALALARRGSGWDAMAYAGGMENRPGLLRLLARRAHPAPSGLRGAAILGNAPEAVAAVRDPRLLFPFLGREGILHPATPGFDHAPAPAGGRRWLFKRRRAAGGGGVRTASAGEPRRPGEFLQEYLSGRTGSIAFAADGKDAVLLGGSEQICGWRALGAPPYRYAGNLAGPMEALLDAGARDGLLRAARRIAARFELRGLNGLDFVVTEAGPAILEVNPRFTASMEILEERSGESFFDRHLEALDGTLRDAPAGTSHGTRREAPAGASDAPAWLAKGILYAEGALTAPEPAALEALGVRDRPHAGERFAPGQPLCTLIVGGRDAADCRARLAGRAGEVRLLFRP